MDLCYLLDSPTDYQRATPLATCIQTLGIKTLRFPFGALADNYLWNNNSRTGTWGPTLTPSVGVKNRTPGSWTWCTDANGYHFNSMDFNEFINFCRTCGITAPVVCVNALSWKYDPNPTAAYAVLTRAAR